MKPYLLIRMPAILLMVLLTTACFPQETNKEDFSRVDKIVEEAIKDKAFPGAVVLVWKDNRIVYEKSFGHFTYDSNSQKVNNSTLFDLASVTKVVATTTAAMICVDKKYFKLEDPIIKYIPEFAVNNKESVTIKNLLLHNSGLPAWKKFYELCKNKEEVLDSIYSSKLEYATGTNTVYSDLGIITLGKIIEKVTGKELDEYCKDEIFVPLEMNSTFFNPPDSLKSRCTPTEFDNYWRNRLIQGEVHDETSAMLGGVAGHAGLFSTVEDLSNFLAMLINKGKFKSKQLINPETIKMFTTRYSESSTRALGWDTRSDKGSSSGDFFSSSSFGHTGFTGTSVWIDPYKNLFVIFLTNRVYPTRENSKIIEVRPKLHNAVMQSLGNL